MVKGENLHHDHVLHVITISYVSKENNLKLDKKISSISGLKGPIFTLQSSANSH